MQHGDDHEEHIRDCTAVPPLMASNSAGEASGVGVNAIQVAAAAAFFAFVIVTVHGEPSPNIRAQPARVAVEAMVTMYTAAAFTHFFVDIYGIGAQPEAARVATEAMATAYIAASYAVLLLDAQYRIGVPVV